MNLFSMRNRIQKQILLLLSLAIVCQPYFCFALESQEKVNNSPSVKDSLYGRIAQQALPVYARYNTQKKEKAPVGEDKEKKEKKFDFSLESLNEYETRAICFDLFSAFSDSTKNIDSKIFGEQCWRDLELLSGPGNTPFLSLLNQLKHTKTVCGEIVLQRMLAQPTIDVVQLKKRQAIIRELVENKELLDQISTTLSSCAQAEPYFFSFWRPEGEWAEKTYKRVYFSIPGLTKLNQSASALELRGRLVESLYWLIAAGIPVLAFLAICYGVKRYECNPAKTYAQEMLDQDLRDEKYKVDDAKFFPMGRPREYPKLSHEKMNRGSRERPSLFKDYKYANKDVVERYNKEFQKIAVAQGMCGKKYWDNMNWKEYRNKTEQIHGELTSRYGVSFPMAVLSLIKNPLFYGKIYSDWHDDSSWGSMFAPLTDSALALSAVLAATCAGFGISQINWETKIIEFLRTRLASVVQIIDALKQAQNLIIQNQMLAQNFSTTHIDALTTNANELTTLINLLSTSALRKKTGMGSLKGNILAAFKLMLKVKNDLAMALEEFGEIDAYCSIANLYKKFEGKNACYCFVDYEVGAQKPHIQATDFWFPSLLNNPGLESVVTNSISMGGDAATQNILLTGPNTGGKSTILKGLITVIALAQSFGIAPAQKVSLTPFSKIETYLNVVDNSAEGISLFKAELMRAKYLINTIDELPKDQFAFTIFDEIFNGTNPTEAVQGSAYIAATLANHTNSLCVIATHFKILTELESLTKGAFRNYRVNVIKNEDGSFYFPFTWEPGISKNKIALELMQKENLYDPQGLSAVNAFAEKIQQGKLQ